MKINVKFHLMVAVVVLLAASAQSVAQDSQAGADKSSSSFPRIAYDERAWKSRPLTEGGFDIAFPGQPGYLTQTVQALAGPIVNHIYGLDIGVAFFAATYADMPVPIAAADKKLVDEALNAGRDKALARVRGRVISEKPLTLDGYTGRELLYIGGDGDGLTHSRSYVVGSRLYQLVIVSDDYRNSPAEDQKFFKEIINRFFTSFKLTRKTY